MSWIQILSPGQLGWLSGLVQPSAQGLTLETGDPVPRRASCVESASPSAYVSASLSLYVSHELINKIWEKKILFIFLNILFIYS